MCLKSVSKDHAVGSGVKKARIDRIRKVICNNFFFLPAEGSSQLIWGLEDKNGHPLKHLKNYIYSVSQRVCSYIFQQMIRPKHLCIPTVVWGDL